MFKELYSRYGGTLIQNVRANLKENIQYRWRGSYVPLLPVTVQVEVTSRCNLECIMCDRTLSLAGHGQHMSLETFRQVVDAFSTARAFHLQGWGEPLLNPKLFEMIALADPAVNRVSFNTNLTVLGRQLADKIVDSGVHEVLVSLDGADKETFEHYRPGATWERVLKNLGILTKRSTDSGSRTEISLVVVCQTRSVRQLPDLVARVAELGLRRLRIQQLREFTNNARLEEDEEFISLLAQAKRDCILKAEETGVAIDWSFYSEWAGPVCSWPWRKVYIRSDGKVNLCCEKVFDPDEESVFGDIHHQSAKEIWNGRRYREARRALSSGSFPQACAGCPIYHFPDEGVRVSEYPL